VRHSLLSSVESDIAVAAGISWCVQYTDRHAAEKRSKYTHIQDGKPVARAVEFKPFVLVNDRFKVSESVKVCYPRWLEVRTALV
jgi:hypothetical protein